MALSVQKTVSQTLVDLLIDESNFFTVSFCRTLIKIEFSAFCIDSSMIIQAAKSNNSRKKPNSSNKSYYNSEHLAIFTKINPVFLQPIYRHSLEQNFVEEQQQLFTRCNISLMYDKQMFIMIWLLLSYNKPAYIWTKDEPLPAQDKPVVMTN